MEYIGIDQIEYRDLYRSAKKYEEFALSIIFVWQIANELDRIVFDDYTLYNSNKSPDLSLSEFYIQNHPWMLLINKDYGTRKMYFDTNRDLILHLTGIITWDIIDNVVMEHFKPYRENIDIIKFNYQAVLESILIDQDIGG